MLEWKRRGARGIGWGGVVWSSGNVYDACSDCVVVVELVVPGDLVAESGGIL